MENRIVIRKLNALTKVELKEQFKRIEEGAYKSEIKALAGYLKNSIGKRLFDDNDVFAAIFGPTMSFSKVKLNRLISDYNIAVDDFISSHVQKANKLHREIDREFDILEFYQERLLQEDAEKALRKLRKKIEQLEQKGAFYFDAIYRLREFELSFRQNQADFMAYQKLNDANDLKYFHGKLMDWVIAANHEKLFTGNFNFWLKTEFLDHLEKQPYGEQPSIQLWLLALKLLFEKEDSEKIEELEAGLYKYTDRLEPNEARDLFQVLSNTLIHLRGIQNELVKTKMLEYLLFQIDKGIILYNGHFPPIIFENVVNLGIKIKGPKWTLQFINENGHQVLPDLRQASIRHGKAKCYFEENNYSQCVEELLKLKRHRFKTIYLDMAVRILRIKAYYDLDRKAKNYDPYQPERDLGALKKFLYMKKKLLSEARFKNRIEFIKIMYRMTLCNDLKKAKIILEELKNEKARISERTWLLAKAHELVDQLQ